MVKQRLLFTFTADLVKEPVMHNLSQQFNVITNIIRADIAEDRGWALVDLDGKEEDIEQGIAWATSRGMRVDPAGEDIITED
ncbi:NIL domain-containing protein [Chloroflexota bacterium]